MKFDIWQSERESAEVVDHGIRVLRRDNPPVATVWNPKATKPAIHNRFSTVQAREDYIRRYVERFGEIKADKEASRQAHRSKAQEMASSVGVGHVFCYSWGYDQTNVQYFQVTEKHGQMVTVREIAQSAVPGSEGFMSCRVEPRVGRFLEPRFDGDDAGKPFSKRLQFTSDGRAYLSMDFGWCELWRGGDHYRSWYA